MTTKEEILRLALRFPDSYSDMPFDDNWTVVRHRDNKKIFAWIFERQGRVWVNLKAPPDWRDLWREAYDSVIPAYHLNKEHWNSVILDDSVPEHEIAHMLDLSYTLTEKKRKKIRTRYVSRPYFSSLPIRFLIFNLF